MLDFIQSLNMGDAMAICVGGFVVVFLLHVFLPSFDILDRSLPLLVLVSVGFLLAVATLSDRNGGAKVTQRSGSGASCSDDCECPMDETCQLGRCLQKRCVPDSRSSGCPDEFNYLCLTNRRLAPIPGEPWLKGYCERIKLRGVDWCLEKKASEAGRR